MLQQGNDHDRLRSKLSSIGYSGEGHEKLVQALVAVHLTLESFELSKDAQDTILDLLSAHGRQSLNTVPEWTEESWQDFDYGNVMLGDFVRVKKNAYDSESGQTHNGLVGILTYMRGGKCTVEYIGLASGKTQKHPMEKLDSLKGVYNRRPSKN